MSLIIKTLLDLKNPAILIRLFMPFFIGLVLVSLLGYGLFGIFLTSDFVTQSPMVQDFETWHVHAEQTIGAIPVIGGLVLWFIGVAVAVIAGLLGIVLGSYLVLLFAMIITGFMTDSLVKAVHKSHYSHLHYEGHGSILGMVWALVKFGLLMILLLLVTFPLLFIPLINVVWFWLIGFIFFRYAIVMDVGQVILPKEAFEKVKSITDWPSSIPMGILYSVSIFPVMSFFAPVLAVILLSHYYFEKLQDEQWLTAQEQKNVAS
ncbi:EI24 domain-containing protein [Hydrogenovibrio kuenenii]|uniref:EI24 domain-containing protein n=1 Tax=Hydrogenovibrio kuenenii TaxID=63658 RepID=UPI000464DBE0|nr:EI24 domain-containing protein [Hydrogenovibrio kuenenii]